MLRRLLSRKGIDESLRETMLASVETRGSAYLPQVNAFYVREFQMMHAAEDVTRFLHHACQGLPHRLNGQATGATIAGESVARTGAIDHYYARVIENAVGYLGSRILYPSRPAPNLDSVPQFSRAACDKAAQAAIRSEDANFQASAQDWGYRIGNQVYEAYLAGKVAPSGLRRLFLAHLDEPGLARKVCGTVIGKLRAISRA
jgi:hypothetical protein